MGDRANDWLRQAEADLRHAGHSLEFGDFEWSCFSAHQAAEKAVKAVFLRSGRDAWGHTVSLLLGNLAEVIDVPDALAEHGKVLDKHYIPTRYPNGFDSGAPTDFYTKKEAEAAIEYAKGIVEFCRDKVHRSG